MSGFYLINEKRFPLQVETFQNKDLLPYYRWEHRVTIGYNGKRYIAFIDQLKQALYIEEFNTKLEKVADEELWAALFRWATEKGYLMVLAPLFKPGHERFV
jgi:hypothetical protein